MKKSISIEQVSEYFKREKDFHTLILDYLLNFRKRLKKRYEKEYSSIIPIRIVACLESYYREIYANLIDSDHQVRNRLSTNDTKWTITLRELDNLEDNYLSVGDFISFQIPCNKVEDIMETLKLLTGKNVFDFIKQKKDGKSLLEVMSEIFKMRHIFAHESALSIKISKEKAIDYLTNSIHFIEYLDEFLNPQKLESTKECITYASFWYKTSSKKLDTLINKLKQAFHEDGDDYLSYMDLWGKYREEKAKYESKLFEGGAYERVAYFISLAETTDDEYNNLKKRYKHILRGLN